MPESVDFRYKCTICGKIFKHKDNTKAEALAKKCERSHDIVLVPLEKSWINAMLFCISTGRNELITPQLISMLKSYR